MNRLWSRLITGSTGHLEICESSLRAIDLSKRVSYTVKYSEQKMRKLFIQEGIEPHSCIDVSRKLTIVGAHNHYRHPKL